MMAYKGQPFQRGGFKGYRSPLKKENSPTKERAICQSRGARYSTEELARADLAMLERTKVNPGALAVFACKACDGFHLGTAFGKSPRSIKEQRKIQRRRPRKEFVACNVRESGNG